MTVKQWQTDIVLKDKTNVYNNSAVTEILQEYLAVKAELDQIK